MVRMGWQPRAVLLWVWLLGCTNVWALERPELGKLNVYFFDVGQGDSALIVSPSGKTVLVDAGPPEHSEALTRRLSGLLDGPLDLAILSHPHLDHLGGMKPVLSALGTQRFMDPAFPHPSAAYRKLLAWLRVAGVEIRGVDSDTEPPLKIGLGEGASLEILWPRPSHSGFLRGTRSDANANSIVALLTYGQVRMLFTGDAERPTERALQKLENLPLSADVLKVAHHGSRHSTSQAFLDLVKPRLAVVSCASNNEYGHPARSLLRRLEKQGARIHRTDEQGDLRLVTDGTSLSVSAERPDPVRSSLRE